MSAQKPTGTSVYELCKYLDRHIGRACGQTCVNVGRGCPILMTSPLAASQNFEYKMSNILDKPLESVFGYTTALPSAFPAYRYKALLDKPLEMYFKGETMHGGGSDGTELFERNMYLAEDRILCFKIVTKQKEPWTCVAWVPNSHMLPQSFVSGFVSMVLPHSMAKWPNIKQLFKNWTFRDIVIWLAFFALFMHAKPWHIFTLCL
ncbi:chitin synthase, partial [Rhizoctonia solani 123E]